MNSSLPKDELANLLWNSAWAARSTNIPPAYITLDQKAKKVRKKMTDLHALARAYLLKD